MDVLALRDRLVADGVSEVKAVYAGGATEREGALNGFTLCLHLETREQFEETLAKRYRREQEMIPPEGDEELARYWSHRYATLQVEWILSCLKVAAWGRPGDTLSSRAALKVGEILAESLGGLRAEALAPPLDHDRRPLDLEQARQALEQLAELRRLGLGPKGYQIVSPYERVRQPDERVRQPREGRLS